MIAKTIGFSVFERAPSLLMHLTSLFKNVSLKKLLWFCDKFFRNNCKWILVKNKTYIITNVAFLRQVSFASLRNHCSIQNWSIVLKADSYINTNQTFEWQQGMSFSDFLLQETKRPSKDMQVSIGIIKNSNIVNCALE